MKKLSELVSWLRADAGIRRSPLLLIGYKATADALSKAVTLVIAVVAARTLTAVDFGVLAVAMTTGWLLSVASDAGLPLYLARRVAATGPETRPSFDDIAEVMRARVVFAELAVVAGLGLAFVLATNDAVFAFAVIVASQVLNAVVETLSHAYRGLGRSDIESSLVVAQRGATGLAALTALALSPSLIWLAAALAIPPAVSLAVSLGIARRLTSAGDSRQVLRPVGRIGDSAVVFGGFAREAAPIGLGVLLSAVYFRCDVYFVEHWHGLDSAGVYNAAFRLVEALRILPAAMLAVVFPSLCHARTFGPLGRLVAGLAGVGVLLMGALYWAAPWLLELLYGSRFLAAAPALRMLALALPWFFVNYALTHQVIAWSGQRAYAIVAAAALVANLVGNLLLIPVGGMLGAATSTLLTELVVAIGCVVSLGVLRERTRPHAPRTEALRPGPA
ncbi:MAG: oligosaccharide flippase family protein [Acidobacteriota bacterium]